MSRLPFKARENLLSQAYEWARDYAIDLTQYCKPVIEYHDERESGAAYALVSFKRKGRNEIVMLDVEYMSDDGDILQGKLTLR